MAYTFTALIPRIDLYSYYFTLGITPMFLFSGIFFPFDELPGVRRGDRLAHAALPPGRGDARAGDRAGADRPAAPRRLLAISAALFVIPVRAVRRRLVA